VLTWMLWMIDVCLSVWTCVVKLFFQIATGPTGFLRFSRNLAHVIYVPIRKNCGTDFRNFEF